MVNRLKNQERIFMKSEGDRYYQRNRQLQLDRKWIRLDPALVLIRQLKSKPKRVLEIGCSDGWRLNAIRKLYRAHCIGIEPSRSALQEGKRLYRGVTFRQGVAEHLPLRRRETFDLVIVNFVLHWVSREALLSSIAEIDRTVADRGHLIVGDFYPNKPTRVPYHHLRRKRVYTYKLDYPAVFASTGLYRLQKRLVFDHATLRPRRSVPFARRAACALLAKSTDKFYAEASVR